MKMMNYYKVYIIICFFMPRSLLKFLFLLITAMPVLAQKKYSFDQICERTSVHIAPKDIPQALRKADSLYMSANEPLEKVKSLMLVAELHHFAGEFKKAICYGENAHSLLGQVEDAEWITRVNEFLAKEYRLLGLHERSKKYTLLGLKSADRITDPVKRKEAAGLLNQELAYYEMEMGNFPNAIPYIEHSLKEFEKIDKDDNGRPAAASYQMLGYVYFRLEDYSLSETYYHKAESLLKEECCILGLVYNGLGGIRLKQKNWKEAEVYLKKAEKIADNSRSLKLKKAVYANINDYYEGTGDNFKASLYATKYVRAYEDMNARSREITGVNIENTPKLHKKNVQISIIKNAAIIVLLTSLVGIVIFFRIKQKKQRSKLRNIIRTQIHQIAGQDKTIHKRSGNQDFSNISVEEVDDKDSSPDKKKNEPLMTQETETKLLELLEDFEKGALYNSKNMSLSFLAAELNTNTKYLSYVINQHKNADFKTYVNRLRISYIVDKLINDDKYRQYKISILADECGFSSHSKFASVFKAVTDFSPSAYIKYLDAENQPDHHTHFHENN